MSTRVEHQPAFILHRRPYRETSWLLDVVTPDYGKVSLVAKGARRGKAPDASLYQPFQPVLISWLGKSDLKTLSGLEARRLAPEAQELQQRGLSGQWLFAGFYLNELLEFLLVEQESSPYLFALYEAALLGLRAQQPLEPLLRYFEKNLLEELGFGASFDQDAETGEPIEAGANYLFLPQKGCLRLDPQARSAYDSCSSVPDEAATAPGKALVVPGEALLAIAEHDFSTPQCLKYAKRIMRLCIDDLLNGRKLRSRELFRHYKESQRA